MGIMVDSLLYFFMGNAGFMSSISLGPLRVVGSVSVVHILRQVASVRVQVDHGKQGFGFRVSGLGFRV